MACDLWDKMNRLERVHCASERPSARVATQRVTTRCCSALQCVVVRCSALQCIAVHCSAL